MYKYNVIQNKVNDLILLLMPARCSLLQNVDWLMPFMCKSCQGMILGRIACTWWRQISDENHNLVRASYEIWRHTRNVSQRYGRSYLSTMWILYLQNSYDHYQLSMHTCIDTRLFPRKGRQSLKEFFFTVGLISVLCDADLLICFLQK